MPRRSGKKKAHGGVVAAMKDRWALLFAAAVVLAAMWVTGGGVRLHGQKAGEGAAPSASETEPAEPAEPPKPPPHAGTVRPRILKRFAHDETSFVQGLELHEGRLLESSGLYGRSRVREVDRETGETVAETINRASQFGEGLTVFNGMLYQLTWKEGVVAIYLPGSLELLSERTMPKGMRQGWGLTHDDTHLVATDGSDTLFFVDAERLEVVRTVQVRELAAGKEVPVPRLNELEYVGGLVYANIWYDTRVAVIDPATGWVVQWLDLAHAVPEAVRRSREAVLNGIAYDREAGTLLITGKLWPELFEIELPEPPRE